MSNYKTRLDRLEAAQPSADPLEFLVSFVDPKTKEAVSMLAIEQGVEPRGFERAKGETDVQFRYRVEQTLKSTDKMRETLRNDRL